MRARSAGLVTEALMSNQTADPSREASKMLAKQFMMQTDADFLVAFQDGQTILILGDPPTADIIAVEDLRDAGAFPDFFATMVGFFANGDGYLRIITASPIPGQDRLELLVPCAAIGAELRAYAGRILLLSVLIAMFVGALIYLAMLRLIVRPVRQLADDMTAFREAPERRRRLNPSLERGDEIGQLQREFHEMKQSLRGSFRQRERLASLGLSVTKINHDLRNVLSTALLMADRLSMNADPALAAMGERLTRTVERGVGLTDDVMKYSSAREAEPDLETVKLGRIVADLQMDMRTAFPKIWINNKIDCDLMITADPEQLHRILSNLFRNAAEAMAGQNDATIDISTDLVADTVIVQIGDNGPGLPDYVEDRLFLPFTRGTREGSTGLGLSISKELAEKMGGSLELLDTSADGTRFILGLPLAQAEA